MLFSCSLGPFSHSISSMVTKYFRVHRTKSACDWREKKRTKNRLHYTCITCLTVSQWILIRQCSKKVRWMGQNVWKENSVYAHFIVLAAMFFFDTRWRRRRSVNVDVGKTIKHNAAKTNCIFKNQNVIMEEKSIV